MRIIAGEARGRTIEAPAGKTTRPTLDRVRENLFNMLQGETDGRRVLDLFAGSGALSLEALSRGAQFAVMVDRDRAANQCQKKNIGSLRMEDRTRVILGDWRSAVRQLEAEGETFDLIFLDPPYEMDDLREVLEALEPVMSGDALIVIEHEGSREVRVPAFFEAIKERKWGYCGVTIGRKAEGRNGEGESE